MADDKTTPKPADDKAPKQAPKRKSGGKSGKRRKALKQPLTELIAGIGTTVYVFEQFDGKVILDNAEQLAESLDKAAKESPAAQRALESLVTGSVWAGVLSSAAAIAVPIAAHHGLLPGPVGALFAAADAPPVAPSSNGADGGHTLGDLLNVAPQPSPAPAPSPRTADAADDA